MINIEEPIVEQLKEQIEEPIKEKIVEQLKEQIEGKKEEQLKEQIEGKKEEQIEGKKEEQIEGKIEEQIEEKREEQKINEIKLLNQGTYGCIFRPDIKCDDGTAGSVKYISKIQKHTKNIEYELFVSSKIKEIKNYQFHYAILIKECDAILSSISEKEIKKCDVLKAIPVNSTIEKKYTSTKIRYVGENSLENYFKMLYLNFFPEVKEIFLHSNFPTKPLTNDDKFMDSKTQTNTYTLRPDEYSKISTMEELKGGGFFDFLFKKPDPSLSTDLSTKGDTLQGFTTNEVGEHMLINKIKHTYTYLLYSLHKLNSHGVIHNDIKENNIMIDDNTQNPIIIDFNLSFLISDIQIFLHSIPKNSSLASAEPPPKPLILDSTEIVKSLKDVFFYSRFYIYYCIDFYFLVYIVNDILNFPTKAIDRSPENSSLSSLRYDEKMINSSKTNPTISDKIDMEKIKIIIESFFVNLYNKSKKFDFCLFDNQTPYSHDKIHSNSVGLTQEHKVDTSSSFNFPANSFGRSPSLRSDESLKFSSERRVDEREFSTERPQEFIGKLEPLIKEIENNSPEFLEQKNKFLEYFQTNYKDKTWKELFDDLTNPDRMITWDNYSLAMTYLISTTNNVYPKNSTFTYKIFPIHSNPENSSIPFGRNTKYLNMIKIWKDIIFALPNERINAMQTIFLHCIPKN